MIYSFDIDGTVCTNTNGNYKFARPLYNRIEVINALFDAGHTIVYWTARGGNSGKDYTEFTKKQLSDWNCKYHELKMNKPSYDVFVDDKAFSDKEYFQCML